MNFLNPEYSLRGPCLSLRGIRARAACVSLTLMIFPAHTLLKQRGCRPCFSAASMLICHLCGLCVDASVVQSMLLSICAQNFNAQLAVQACSGFCRGPPVWCNKLHLTTLHCFGVIYIYILYIFLQPSYFLLTNHFPFFIQTKARPELQLK